MGKLIELFETEVQIVTEKEEGLPKHALARLYYQFAQGDQKNLNGRIYPSDLLSKRMEEKEREIKESGVLGQLDHPLDGRTKLQKAMHVLEALTFDKETKKCYAESLVLATQAGRDFMTILGAGAKLGASMRGWARNVHPTSRKVSNDWKLESIDFVLNPSFGADAQIDKTNLIESANSLMLKKEILNEEEVPSEEELKEMNLVSEEEEQTLLGIAYESLKALGRTETWEEFYKANRGLYQNKSLAEMAEVLKQNIEKRAKARRIQPKDIIDEALISGISPTKYAEILNRRIEEQIIVNEVLTEDEKRAILKEAGSSGVDTTDPKEREKYLNSARRQRIKNRKPLTEEQKNALTEETKKEKEIEKQANIGRLMAEKISSGADRTYLDEKKRQGRY